MVSEGVEGWRCFRKRRSARFSFASVVHVVVKDAAHYYRRDNAIASKGKWQESKADYRGNRCTSVGEEKKKQNKINKPKKNRSSAATEEESKS